MTQFKLAITCLLSIARGAYVRSWDSECIERRTYKGNWIEGIVEDIRPVPELCGDNCDRYVIRVTADFWEGTRVSGDGSRVGQYVYPPVNGSKGAFSGREADGVEYLDEIDPVIWETYEQHGGTYIRPQSYWTVRQIVQALSARLTSEDMIDEYDALGGEYKWGNREADTPIKGQPSFEVSVSTGGSEGHRVTVRMIVVIRDDAGSYNPREVESSVIYSVKTFTGFEGAFRIAKRITKLLGC
jgi:hypothetical protein